MWQSCQGMEEQEEKEHFHDFISIHSSLFALNIFQLT
jgi:hypothetical protein